MHVLTVMFYISNLNEYIRPCRRDVCVLVFGTFFKPSTQLQTTRSPRLLQYRPAKMIARKNDRRPAAGGNFFPAEMIARKNDRRPAAGGQKFYPQKWSPGKWSHTQFLQLKKFPAEMIVQVQTFPHKWSSRHTPHERSYTLRWYSYKQGAYHLLQKLLTPARDAPISLPVRSFVPCHGWIRRALRNWHLSTVLVEYASDNCMTNTQYRGSKIPNTSSSQRHGKPGEPANLPVLIFSSRIPGNNREAVRGLEPHQTDGVREGKPGTECTPT